MENSHLYTRKLHGLLESLNDVQKKDIKEVCGGHLNENYLCRKENTTKTKIWESANKPIQRDSMRRDFGKTANVLPPLENMNICKMKSSMMEFALGINSDTQVQKSSMRDYGLSKQQHKSESMLPDIVLPVSPKKGELPFSRRFIPSHLLGPSKRDQYKKLQHIHTELFKDKSIRKITTVEEIEERLRKKLKQLEKDQDLSVPNFYKLQAYSDAWEQLCESCGTHGEFLRSAKANYDAYVTFLLDEQLKLNQPDRIHIMTTQNNDLQHIVNTEKDVDKLEEEIMKELDENKRLRKKLEEARGSNQEILAFMQKDNDRSKGSDESRSTDIAQQKLDNNNNNSNSNNKNNKEDLEHQIEALHAQIELQLHELENLKKDRRENYVPLVMCQRLENCIKETEIDIQKLCKQNEFLEHNIEELEEELQKTLVNAGMKTSDAQTLWRRVNVSHLLEK